MGYGRLLADTASVEHFLTKCLPSVVEYKDSDGKVLSVDDIFGKIEDAESLVDRAGCTHREPGRRSKAYRSDEARTALHSQIVQELIEHEREADDENIRLGQGGAKPLTSLKFEKQAYLITGLPASGKSGVAAKVCDAYGAYLIDPDFAKRKIPEFDKSIAGASRVHRESMQIALGTQEDQAPNLLSACIAMKVNIVRPLIGNDADKLEVFCKNLQDKGYSVHLSLVDLDRKHAAGRALRRFLETDRYVSLPYIFDDCANDAALVYYRYRSGKGNRKRWASFGAISTVNAAPTTIDIVGKGNPAELFRVRP